MLSKHSALGSRILGIIRNNDVMASSHSAFFKTKTKNGGRLCLKKKKQGLGTSFGKIYKENVQREKESRQGYLRRSRSSNYAIFGHFTVLF